jgi:hypothetical protein
VDGDIGVAVSTVPSILSIIITTECVGIVVVVTVSVSVSVSVVVIVSVLVS